MKRCQLFQRMIPFRLKTINDYSDLSSLRRRIAVFKPIGMEVYITPERNIFDHNGNEIRNPSIHFQLESIFKRAESAKSMLFGVLTSTDETFMASRKWAYVFNYTHNFSDVKFECYDMIFPYFSANFNYKTRLDQAKTVFKGIANFETVDHEEIGDFASFNKLVYDKFNPYNIDKIYLFDTNKIYRQGISHNKKLAPMYEIIPNQRYRTHLKNIIPNIVLDSTGKGIKNRTEVASLLIGKYKKQYLEIPIVDSSIILKKSIWDKKDELRNMPFWFTGFTVYIDQGTKITGVKFHKFIL